ncbi:hypothetical protein JCM15519_24470 [Fundidesulfovibrio butyratiphilus]
MSKHLVKFNVFKLFKSFDHTIDLNQIDGVTIITAPNGYGKTAILRIINAFFQTNFRALMDTPYESISLLFDDGSTIKVIQRNDGKQCSELKFILEIGGAKSEEYKHKLNTRIRRQFPLEIIEEIIPSLERVGPHKWLDTIRNIRLDIDDVFNIYGGAIKSDNMYIKYSMRDDIEHSGKNAPPEWLTATINSIDCRFIETQRLLDFSPRRIRGAVSPRPASIAVVEGQAVDLREKIQEQLAEFTNKSQERDRTFPQRVIELSTRSIPNGSPIDIQGQIQRLEEKRSKLVEAGILDSSEGYVPIAIGHADNSTLNVLQVYVEDNFSKLEIFDSLFKKVSVFLNIINGKFLMQRMDGAKKKIKCDRNKGFIVETMTGEPINLNQLSSGEQHEIVLFYEIIFKMGANTLLLIDEPELSLHVGWQKQFVPDLLEIISANEMRVLLATHSPQIINDRRDLRVGLGL